MVFIEKNSNGSVSCNNVSLSFFSKILWSSYSVFISTEYGYCP